MEALTFSIDLPVRSEWGNVDLLRTSVRNWCTAVFRDVAVCHALAMVTGELVENAIKHGDWAGSDDQRFRLRLWGEGRHAHVLVENPVHGRHGRAEEVLNALRWMRGFPSTSDAYRAKLLEMAAAELAPDRRKFGLVRIAYEGNCVLTAELARGVLRVQAELAVEPGIEGRTRDSHRRSR